MGEEGESFTLVVGVSSVGGSGGVATTAAGKTRILSWETRSARSVQDGEGREWRRERGPKAMTARRRNRLHKEVCLQKQTGTGGNWYNTVKINQYDLLTGSRSFRRRSFETIKMLSD